jgi:hypothetical protein
MAGVDGTCGLVDLDPGGDDENDAVPRQSLAALHGEDSLNEWFEFVTERNTTPCDESSSPVTEGNKSVWERVRVNPDRVKSSTRFPTDMFLKLYSIIEESLGHKGKQGRQSKLSKIDMFFMTLSYLAHYPEAENAPTSLFGIQYNTFMNIVSRTINSIAPILKAKFIRRIPLSVQHTYGWTFPDYPSVSALCDATLIPTKKPTNRTLQRDTYSGKHKKNGFKIQTINACNGVVMDVTEPFGGRRHDFSIFQENFSGSIFSELRNVNGRIRETMYSCMFDLGYIGANRLMNNPTIPIRALPRQRLSVQEEEFNQHLGTHRVIIENYYGRLKNYWKILGLGYRGSKELLKNIVYVCIALTNILVIAHPLRKSRESGDPLTHITSGIEWINTCALLDIRDDDDDPPSPPFHYLKMTQLELNI